MWLYLTTSDPSPIANGIPIVKQSSSLAWQITRCQQPIWDDITTLQPSELRASIDIITAGFPCQDISCAGTRKGLAGERSALFFEILRLAKEIVPRWIFLENVPAITSRGGTQVLKELNKMGYNARWCVISAASVGALHKRERWFLLAHTTRKRFKKTRQPLRQKTKLPINNDKTQYDLSDKEPENKFELVRMANGVQDRAHRIKALGNSVVPQQAKEAFEILMGLK